MRRHSTVLILAVLLAISGLLKIAPVLATPEQRSFTQMLNFGEVRMAIPYGQISYVNAKNQIYGIAPDLAKSVGDYLSTKYRKKIHIKIIPSPPGQLLALLDQGDADFAIDYFQEHDLQKNLKKFLVYEHPRSEKFVVVSRNNQNPINKISDLSGQTLCVGRTTRISSLNKTNEELLKSGITPIHLYQDHLVLNDEDLLQMVNDGLVDFVWVANWQAQLWKPLLPNIMIHTDTASEGGSSGDVIVTKINADLAKDILEFAASPHLDKVLENYRQKTFIHEKNALKNPLSKNELNRFESMKTYFHRYGRENQLDPLFLAGLGFQESLLNQNAVSPVGAIGVMQLMLETGKSMNTGNIYELEPNIHAGAKYINSLLYAMSLQNTLPETERGFFAVAAYNSGANNVRKARELAVKMGLDPNQWFFNVEMASARLLGLETFLYVRNVYKYYVTYDVWIRKTALDQEKFNPKR